MRPRTTVPARPDLEPALHGPITASGHETAIAPEGFDFIAEPFHAERVRRSRTSTMLRSAPRRSSLLPAVTLGLAVGLGVAGSASASVPTDAPITADAQDETAATDVELPADFELEELGPGVADPRRRRPPRTHRFRLAFQMDHVRLSAAVDDEGMTQRFHYLPLQLDFGYQVQLFKVMMLRPSIAFGANPGNTVEAMPAVVHPQIFGGFQGKAFGLALGYGYMHPFPSRKDVISDTRGGLGQPIITANHALRAELSFTTRVDRGALGFGLRLGGLKSHIQHYDLDERSWRFFWGLQIAWYFGDGTKSEERQRERQRARRERKRR